MIKDVVKVPFHVLDSVVQRHVAVRLQKNPDHVPSSAEFEGFMATLMTKYTKLQFGGKMCLEL